MKITHLLLCIGLCSLAISCRTHGEVTSTTSNPYMEQFLPAAQDSVNRQELNPSLQVERLNRKSLHEKVNPEKEASLADILRNFIRNIFPKR